MSVAERLAIEVPPKMRMLPKDKRGYPVPWIVQRDLTGRPFFVMNDQEKVGACVRRKLCGICGQKLERDVWLVGGPGAAFHENGVFLDPAMHKACAVYALRVCPYIAGRYTGRVEAAFLKHGKWDPRMGVVFDESMIPEQPPFFVLGRTRRAGFLASEAGTFRVVPVRPWLEVEFWHHGRRLDEAEARERLAASEPWKWTPDDLLFWPKPEVVA
jgi:hypothetical protein